jgi:glycerol-3-phosphate O-acyltransferase
MSTETPSMGLLARLQLHWRLFLRAILHLWVKARTLPDPPLDLGIDADKPVCYVIDSYSLSSVLILDQNCEEVGLPRPLYPLALSSRSEPRSFLALRRKKGLLIRRTTPRTHSETLKRLVDAVYEGAEQDIQLVPVTVLVGRAPDKETGLAKIFFSESWEIGGRIRRLLSTLVNGRSTLVQFSPPLSLKELAEEELGAARSLRKVSRILRVHFHRVRSAAIGPDLSHRRMVVAQVLRNPGVTQAIGDTARKEKISEHKAWKQARANVYEISADYSYAFVRMAAMALTWFWHRIYDGVELRHFRKFKEQAPNYTVIYVPCHRSHIDYLLISYFIYHNGLVPPHVAGGINLNLPVLGRLVRKGGAFFLRRSFRSQKLYSAVFHAYLSQILSQGTSIEYFVEGTRSRTGRLLAPKGGMLSMTVRGYLSSPGRPVMFQPIYLGYERLVEGNSYTAELSGEKKKSEKLSDLFKVFGVMRKRYGKVHVSFAEPIVIDDLLDRYEPQWRETSVKTEQKPPWLNPLIDELGTRIMTGINDAAHVNAINLLSAVLLTMRKQALGRAELLTQLSLYLDLLAQGCYSDRVTYTRKTPDEIIAYGLELGAIVSRDHPLGEIIALNPERSVLLTYFRNNISHLVAMPSLVTSCFLNSRTIEKAHLHQIANSIYPFLKAELFLTWEIEEFPDVIDRQIDWLKEHGLLTEDTDNGMLERVEGGTDKALQLSIMGNGLLQTFERYYITIAILAKNGSGTLTRPELERLCILTAQRISELNEFAAPEFYDRNLFRQFIGLLKQTGALSANEDGGLEFGHELNRISDEAKVILSKEIRHGITRSAPQVLPDSKEEEPSAQPS